VVTFAQKVPQFARKGGSRNKKEEGSSAVRRDRPGPLERRNSGNLGHGHRQKGGKPPEEKKEVGWFQKKLDDFCFQEGEGRKIPPVWSRDAAEGRRGEKKRRPGSRRSGKKKCKRDLNELEEKKTHVNPRNSGNHNSHQERGAKGGGLQEKKVLLAWANYGWFFRGERCYA